MIEVHKMLSDHCGYDKSVTELLRLSTNTHMGTPIEIRTKESQIGFSKVQLPKGLE